MRVAYGPFNLVLECFVQFQAIGQSGQPVGLRQDLDAFLVRDVVTQRCVSDVFAIAVKIGLHRHIDPVGAAVLRHALQFTGPAFAGQ